MSALPSNLYTAEQVRCLDASAINAHGIPGYTLMQRAGRAVFEAAVTRFPDASHWSILCGAGNNAGDGYIIAKLAMEAEKPVRVYPIGSIDKLTGDARKAADDWLAGGGRVSSWPAETDHGTPDLVIDALLGTGLDRPVEGIYREAIEWMNAQSCPGIAVDIPSGLNADTGQVMGVSLQAVCTVSFIGLKQGLFTNDGPECVGELVFNSLDIPETVYDCVTDHGKIIHEKILVDLLEPRKLNTHKGHYGHVLVVGGDAGMAGAARLAGEAALRSGSGLVSIATHRAHATVMNLARPELMVSAVTGDQDLLPLIEKASVLAVGPGLGMNDWSQGLLHSCLDAGKPLVIDADGLNLLSGEESKRENWILTPHPAEAGRLLATSTAEIQANRVESARALADKFGGIAVLKGCGTVLAASDGRFAVCPLGNPGMATAGSGDVLTGIIAAFLGQGLEPWQAAQAGVAAHAAAGDYAAGIRGERSMIASDIIDSLGQVLP